MSRNPGGGPRTGFESLGEKRDKFVFAQEKMENPQVYPMEVISKRDSVFVLLSEFGFWGG